MPSHADRSLIDSPSLFSLVAHLAEKIHDAREHNEQDTSSGPQSQHLGQETLVQRAEPFLPCDRSDSRECPVVLWNRASDLGRVLDTRLDDIQGRVDDSSDGTSHRTRNQVVCDLALLSRSRGQELTDLEDAAKVSRVPEDVSPHCGLEALVEGKGPFLLDDLGDAVDHAIVLVRLGLILQADLDELEGDDDEGFGCAGGGTSEDGEGLVHLGDAEEIAVEGAPRVVGGELGGPGSSKNDFVVREGDTVYLLGASIRIGAEIPRYNLEALPDVNPWLPRGASSSIPLMLDDLPEAIYHAIVCVVTHGFAGLELSGRV
jgi:hypothetical protein